MSDSETYKIIKKQIKKQTDTHTHTHTDSTDNKSVCSDLTSPTLILLVAFRSWPG